MIFSINCKSFVRFLSAVSFALAITVSASEDYSGDLKHFPVSPNSNLLTPFTNPLTPPANGGLYFSITSLPATVKLPYLPSSTAAYSVYDLTYNLVYCADVNSSSSSIPCGSINDSYDNALVTAPYMELISWKTDTGAPSSLTALSSNNWAGYFTGTSFDQPTVTGGFSVVNMAIFNGKLNSKKSTPNVTILPKAEDTWKSVIQCNTYTPTSGTFNYTSSSYHNAVYYPDQYIQFNNVIVGLGDTNIYAKIAYIDNTYQVNDQSCELYIPKLFTYGPDLFRLNVNALSWTTSLSYNDIFTQIPLGTNKNDKQLTYYGVALGVGDIVYKHNWSVTLTTSFTLFSNGYILQTSDTMIVKLELGVGNLAVDTVSYLSQNQEFIIVDPLTTVTYSFKRSHCSSSSRGDVCPETHFGGKSIKNREVMKNDLVAGGVDRYGRDNEVYDCSTSVSQLGTTSVDIKSFTMKVTSPLSGFIISPNHEDVAIAFKGAIVYLDMARNILVGNVKGSFGRIILISVGSQFFGDSTVVSKRVTGAFIVLPNGDVISKETKKVLFNLFDDDDCGRGGNHTDGDYDYEF